MTKQTKNGGMDDGTKLNWKELSANTAYETLVDTPPGITTPLALINNKALLHAFAVKRQFDNAAIQAKMNKRTKTSSRKFQTASTAGFLQPLSRYSNPRSRKTKPARSILKSAKSSSARFIQQPTFTSKRCSME